MLKRMTLAAFTFLFLPLTSTAAPITIEYSGYISGFYNGGWGGNLGERVNGFVTIDLSKSAGTLWDTPNSISHYAPAQYGLVEGDYPWGDIADGTDFVDIYNNSAPGSNEDRLWLHDITNFTTSPTGWKYTAIQLSFTLQGLDWITDLTLSNVNINTTDPLALSSSFGVFDYGVGTIDTNGNSILENRATFFAFDSLKISSHSVPESSSIILILIGLLSLIIRRKLT